MLRANELARLRTDLAKTLPGSCQISRQVATDDPEGGQVLAWQDIGDPVPCRVLKEIKQPLAVGDEGEIQYVSMYPVQLPYVADVQISDRLIIAGLTYNVLTTNAGLPERVDLQAKGVLVQ